MPSKARADKSLESWIWDAACSIRGAQEAPKYKDFILPLVFAQRLCDIPEDGIERIAAAFLRWKEEEKFSRIVAKAEVVKNDYNISPSRYIHTAEAETYRPVAEIVAELKVAEAEARRSNAALKKVLARLGIEA